MAISRTFDIYTRVSDVGDREGDSYGSPETQETSARACAQRLELEIGEVAVVLPVASRVVLELKGDTSVSGAARARSRTARGVAVTLRRMERRAYSIQPDPKREFFVQPNGGKLVRRSRCAYSIVWRTPDGKEAETPIGRGSFHAAS